MNLGLGVMMGKERRVDHYCSSSSMDLGWMMMMMGHSPLEMLLDRPDVGMGTTSSDLNFWNHAVVDGGPPENQSPPFSLAMALLVDAGIRDRWWNLIPRMKRSTPWRKEKGMTKSIN